jgi:hypothetical protein
MPRYQLYLLDERGCIKEAVSFDVGSDEEAKDYVEVQGEHRAMELWSGSHVVEQYPARDPARAQG